MLAMAVVQGIRVWRLRRLMGNTEAAPSWIVDQTQVLADHSWSAGRRSASVVSANSVPVRRHATDLGVARPRHGAR